MGSRASDGYGQWAALLTGLVITLGVLGFTGHRSVPRAGATPATSVDSMPPAQSLTAAAAGTAVPSLMRNLAFAAGITPVDAAPRAPMAISEPPAAPVPPRGPQIFTYIVQPGDTMWDLAQQFGVDETTILSLNPKFSPKRLQPGDELRILSEAGTAHLVAAGDTLTALANLYGVTVDSIVAANNLSANDTLTVGAELLIPGGRPPRRTVSASRGDSGRGTGGWAWPLRGRITSEFGTRWGRKHQGLDIAAPSGTPVQAAKAGKVVSAGWDGGYGNAVVIDHGDGTRSRYAHASKILVERGQWIEQGQNVVNVGNTGNSYGSHLHFEVIVNGSAQNPRNYLP